MRENGEMKDLLGVDADKVYVKDGKLFIEFKQLSIRTVMICSKTGTNRVQKILHPSSI